MKNTTLCYLERDGQYLMLHRTRKAGDASHDKWLGVGGKFEDKESPEDCVLRETKEETGLTLTSYRYRGIVTFVSDRLETEYMHLFTASCWQGQMTACDEGELVWVDQDKVMDLPIWEGDKIFFGLLAEDRPFFSLKLTYVGEKLTGAVLNGQVMDPFSRKTPQ